MSASVRLSDWDGTYWISHRLWVNLNFVAKSHEKKFNSFFANFCSEVSKQTCGQLYWLVGCIWFQSEVNFINILVDDSTISFFTPVALHLFFWCQFRQCSSSSFCARRSRKCKNDWQLDWWTEFSIERKSWALLLVECTSKLGHSFVGKTEW